MYLALKTIGSLLLLLALAACGGGGGGGGSADPAPAAGGGTNAGGGTSNTGGTNTGNNTGNTGGSDAGGSSTGSSSSSSAEFGFTRESFIDGSLVQSCMGSYNPETRRCAGGSATAYRSFAAAATAAEPGMLFLIRAGDYTDALRLAVSGTESNYVGYEAYNGEVVTIRGVNSSENGEDYGPIWLDGVSYTLIKGLRVTGSVGFVRAVNSHYNVIEDCVFDTSELYPGASKRGGLYFAWSNFNKVLNNTIIRGTDSLALIRSNNNLVEGNTFESAGHDVWNIKCGSFNVIRGNSFTNPDQKVGSVFDCESATSNWHGNGSFAQAEPILDDTKHNVIENNVFRETSDWYSTSGGNAIQYAGQLGIIRNNVFIGANVGLGMTQYDSEALFNYGNRVYHNVFHDNLCAGIFTQGDDGSGGRIEDNVYKNNALWDNRGWDTDDGCEGNSTGQLVFRGSLTGHRFSTNALASSQGTAVVQEEFGLGGTVDDFNFDGAFANTVLADPRFTNAVAGDFTLASDSPLIDAGEYLTSATAPGSGTVLQVNDALYFFDGFGIPGVLGDRIQLEGQATTARILEVDYELNVLTLDTSLTWDAGQGVTHAFAGASPDIGAFER